MEHQSFVVVAGGHEYIKRNIMIETQNRRLWNFGNNLIFLRLLHWRDSGEAEAPTSIEQTFICMSSKNSYLNFAAKDLGNRCSQSSSALPLSVAVGFGNVFVILKSVCVNFESKLHLLWQLSSGNMQLRSSWAWLVSLLLGLSVSFTVS